MQFILHEVEKEIFESDNKGIRIGIDERKLRRAIYNRVPVKVIWNGLEKNINPVAWMKTGEMKPKVFLYKDNPMKLWYNFCKFEPVKSQEETKREEFLKYQSI